MLRIRTVNNRRGYQANLVQKSYRVRYQEQEGHLLLSENKISVLKEKAGSRIGYNTILELLYKHIVSLTAETCHRLTFVDNDNRTYSLISNAGISAYTIEAEIKSKIAPLDYPQHG